MTCRVAIDAMGGDKAPEVVLEGLRLFRENDSTTEIFLTGNPDILNPVADELACTVVPASQVIEMGESPSAALKSKRDSSIAKAIQLVKDGQADSAVTMGHSGAAIAFALFQLGRIPGVSRPALMTPMPNMKGRTLVLDVGAVVDCKPEHLLHFAVLASVYAEMVYGVQNPRVGLLSIGEERSKGNELTIAALSLLDRSGLNFLGHVEGNNITDGSVDIVVCDGFVGNVILKFGEGLVEYIMQTMSGSLRHVLEATHADSETSKHQRAFFRSVVSGIDYTEIGCAPLMGVTGLCFIGHGRSEPPAIASAIATARNAAAHSDVIQRQGDVLQRVLDNVSASTCTSSAN